MAWVFAAVTNPAAKAIGAAIRTSPGGRTRTQRHSGGGLQRRQSVGAASRDGGLKFYNRRAEGWWRLREDLDPDQPFGSAIALPPDASMA
jgi:hypothetical protein